MTKDFTNRQGGGGKKLNKLRRRSRGVIALEVCFTLPVVVYLIFFTIELIKVNITQDALQSICEEATYLTIAHDYEDGADLTNKIDAIIEKYRPTFIPKEAPGYKNTLQPVIRWCFETYPMFGQSGDMLSRVPYGGSSILYASYELHECAKLHAQSGFMQNSSQFIPTCNMECWTNADYVRQTRFMKGSGLPDNEVFTITITCNYPFSSNLVKWLFNNGVNTKVLTKNPETRGYNQVTATSHKKGTMYILWARGAGIVNAK